MAFRKKAEVILQMKPDILIIQECEDKTKLATELKMPELENGIWIGSNKHKGIAVFAFNGIRIELSERYNQEIEYFIPVKVITIEKKHFNLFAVWAMPFKGSKLKSYVGRVWEGVNYYAEELSQSSILVGDLNSNAIWDKERKVGNHSAVVEYLKEKGLESLYHRQYKMQHGQEVHPTFYLHKNEGKPYHMDYCFVSRNLISKQTDIEVGEYKNWISLSDHMPLLVSLIKINSLTS